MSKLTTVWVYKQLGDFTGTLSELGKVVEELSCVYGSGAVVKFDAGYNNIDCSLTYDPTLIPCGVNESSSHVCHLGTKGCIVEAHISK